MNQFCPPQAAALLDVARPATKAKFADFEAAEDTSCRLTADTSTSYTGR